MKKVLLPIVVTISIVASLWISVYNYEHYTIEEPEVYSMEIPLARIDTIQIEQSRSRNFEPEQPIKKSIRKKNKIAKEPLVPQEAPVETLPTSISTEQEFDLKTEVQFWVDLLVLILQSATPLLAPVIVWKFQKKS